MYVRQSRVYILSLDRNNRIRVSRDRMIRGNMIRNGSPILSTDRKSRYHKLIRNRMIREMFHHMHRMNIIRNWIVEE